MQWGQLWANLTITRITKLIYNLITQILSRHHQTSLGISISKDPMNILTSFLEVRLKKKNLFDFKWIPKCEMSHLNKYKLYTYIIHQRSSICQSYWLCYWELHDSFIQFSKGTMIIFHWGINRRKMISF